MLDVKAAWEWRLGMGLVLIASNSRGYSATESTTQLQSSVCQLLYIVYVYNDCVYVTQTE